MEGTAAVNRMFTDQDDTRIQPGMGSMDTLRMRMRVETGLLDGSGLIARTPPGRRVKDSAEGYSD